MLKRHENGLRDAIDGLTIHGYCHLSKATLRLWYGQERMSKAIWRDIAEKLPEDWTAEDVTIFQWEDDVILIETTCLSKMADEV